MKNMSVRAAEFEFTVHAEGVVPDHPASTVKANVLTDDFQFGGIVIADGQPERAGRFQGAIDFADPFSGPIEIFRRRFSVFVDVVFVANIERRISKREIDTTFVQLLHCRNAVQFMNRVPSKHQKRLLPQSIVRNFRLGIVSRQKARLNSSTKIDDCSMA